MRSNYKQLGSFIRPVDIRNRKEEDLPLLGVSVQKVFITSIANTVGTDFSKYKKVKCHQFTYIPDTSRRGDKIGIAMLSDYDEALVSQAYTVFEIIDHNLLDPEYLMMWFRRPEFDRYARFKSHGSVREIFDWQELCETELPIPSIEKQREIVREYNTIVNRIAFNEQLIQKLEETAQTIYKRWFVEGIDLENLPEGWRVGRLNDLIEFRNGKSKPAKCGEYPVYGGNGIIDYVIDFNAENVIPIGRVGAYCGSLYRETGKCWISDNAISAKSREDCNMFAYFLMVELKLNERSEGTGQPLITQGLLNEIEVVIPKSELIEKFEKIATITFKMESQKERETQKLSTLKNLILSKMTKIEEFTEKEMKIK